VRPYVVFALSCFSWGSTFLPARLALTLVPPIFLAGVRFVLASSILFFWLIVTKQELKARGQRASSLLSVTVSFSLLFWGIKHLPSGLSGVMSFAGGAIALPVFSVLDQERLSSKNLLGVCLGVVSFSTFMFLRNKKSQLELKTF
jgi:drug/metabolite transporter (DMT)-like permease